MTHPKHLITSAALAGSLLFGGGCNTENSKEPISAQLLKGDPKHEVLALLNKPVVEPEDSTHTAVKFEFQDQNEEPINLMALDTGFRKGLTTVTFVSVNDKSNSTVALQALAMLRRDFPDMHNLLLATNAEDHPGHMLADSIARCGLSVKGPIANTQILFPTVEANKQLLTNHMRGLRDATLAHFDVKGETNETSILLFNNGQKIGSYSLSVGHSVTEVAQGMKKIIGGAAQQRDSVGANHR